MDAAPKPIDVVASDPRLDRFRGIRDRELRGTLGLHGALPTNTDGGHLSNSYMQGWALNVEAVRQLRGECGARQIKDCNIIQYVAVTPCTRSIIYSRA
jgi:hypothetical protein